MLFKKYLSFIIGLLFATFSVAQENKELTLVVVKNDGTYFAYCLDKFPIIEVGSEIIKVSYNNVTDSYFWNELAVLGYVDRNELPDKISKIKNNDLTVLFFEDEIQIITKKRQKFSIYDITGKKVLSDYIDDNSKKVIRYSNFSRGIYVIKTDNHNFKFFVK